MVLSVYINKQNEDPFRGEQNKSKLINTLLTKHYSETTTTLTSEMVEVSHEDIFGAKGSCPNGHPLGTKGKCFKLNCKYSV